MLSFRNHAVVVATMVSAACGSAGTDASEIELNHDLTRPDIPSFEEFEAATRVERDGEVHYVVEGDIALTYEGLTRYYEAALQSEAEKLTGTLVLRIFPTDVFIAARPMPIRYCVSDGWTSSSPGTKADLLKSLQEGIIAWQSVANIRFDYRPELDGASCDQTLVEDGSVDIWVTPHPTPTTASAPFPNFSPQNISVGLQFIADNVLKHELGHVLGFQHEQYHPESTINPACDPGTMGAEFYRPFNYPLAPVKLSEFDPLSIMLYLNGGAPSCVPGAAPSGNLEVSRQDAIGARNLYGEPPAWASTWTPMLL